MVPFRQRHRRRRLQRGPVVGQGERVACRAVAGGRVVVPDHQAGLRPRQDTPFRSTDLVPLGSATPTPFQDDPFHRAASTGGLVAVARTRAARRRGDEFRRPSTARQCRQRARVAAHRRLPLAGAAAARSGAPGKPGSAHCRGHARGFAIAPASAVRAAAALAARRPLRWPRQPDAPRTSAVPWRPPGRRRRRARPPARPARRWRFCCTCLLF